MVRNRPRLVRSWRLEAVEGVGKGGQELGVFGGGTYADADGFGETHPGHGADDDTFTEEFVAESFGIRADGDEKKIGFAGNGREMELGKFEKEAAALVAIGFDGAADVFGVVEGGEGSGLTDAGDVEGSAELVHFGDEGGMADAVADAESGEAVDLGECV